MRGAGRSVRRVPERLLWRQRLRALWRGLLAAALPAGIGAFLILWPLADIRDVEGRPALHGAGVITSVRYGVANQYGHVGPDAVFIALDSPGPSFLYWDETRKLRQGQRVRVTYRVGRSGRIHVDAVEPDL